MNAGLCRARCATEVGGWFCVPRALRKAALAIGVLLYFVQRDSAGAAGLALAASRMQSCGYPTPTPRNASRELTGMSARSRARGSLDGGARVGERHCRTCGIALRYRHTSPNQAYGTPLIHWRRGPCSAALGAPLGGPFRTQHPLGALVNWPSMWSEPMNFPRRVGLYAEYRLIGG